MHDTIAALEIDHVTCTAEGAAVEYSIDIFLPRSLDLHVMRWLEDPPPVPAIGAAEPLYKFAQSGAIVAAPGGSPRSPTDTRRTANE